MSARPTLRAAALLAAVLLTVPALTGCASDAKGSSASVVVESAWVRATTGAKDPSMTGAFMTLRNTGAGDVRLSKVSTSVAGRAELHRMAMDGGKAHMHRVRTGFAVPGHGTTELKPGGLHAMLVELRQPLRAGDEVTLVLTFADGGTKTVVAPVKAYAEEGGYAPTPSASPTHSMSPGMVMPSASPTHSMSPGMRMPSSAPSP